MIKIQTIEIKIRTNIPGERDFQPLTSSMFLFNKPTAAAATTNYPYFRVDVPFTLDMLNGKTAYEFFFHQKAFLEGVGTSGSTSTSDPLKMKTLAQENVIFLLKTLFLTSYPIEDNVEQSYDTNILQTTSQVGRHSVIPEFISKWLFPTSSETPFTYLSLSSGKYSVIGVTWINDVVNHSRYRKLMKEVIRFKDKKQKKMLDIEPNLVLLSNKFYSKRAWQKRFTKLITEISGIVYTLRPNDTDVGFRRIKEWMDQQPWTGNSALLSNDSDGVRERILILADYFSKFYKIQAQILEETSSSYRSRSALLSKLQSLPNFREFIEYSRDFIKQTQLKNYLSGDNPKTLLEPITSRRLVTELHTVLSEDSDFCAMVNRVLAYVPDQTLNLKQPRYNPILKRLQVPDSNARILLTTNTDLQDAITSYLLNGCSDEPFEQFADYLSVKYFSQEKLQPSGTTMGAEKLNQGENLSWMNTNVVQLTKDMYGIELQVELMQGMLDNKIIQQISCAFENKRLQSEYDRLKNKTDQVPLYLQQPRTMFSIESFLQPAAPLAAPPLAAVPVNKKGGGGRKTRRRLRPQST